MSADLRAKALEILSRPGPMKLKQWERDILIETFRSTAKDLLAWKPKGLAALDDLEHQLRGALRAWEFLTQDKVKARKTLLDSAANERDRAIYAILIKQNASTRGKRSGNRKNITTRFGDGQILREFENWQTNRSEPGSNRQFAIWWHRQEAKKEATKADIRRTTKRLRDARRRVEHQST
jgi:hypothetical protein